MTTKDLDQLSTPTPLRPAVRRMTVPETRVRPVEHADASSKSRPIALTKSPKKSMMRYDRSSVTLAMKSELHGASVAQVPADATRSCQSPTSTAQSRRPLVAASKTIKITHLPPVAAKKAAAEQRLDAAQRPPAAPALKRWRRRWMMEAWWMMEAVAEDGSGGGGGGWWRHGGRLRPQRRRQRWMRRPRRQQPREAACNRLR